MKFLTFYYLGIIVGGFLLLLGLYNGLLIGGLSETIKAILSFVSVMLPLMSIFEYSTVSYVVSMIKSDHPSASFLKDQINIFLTTKENKHWFFTFYDKHLMTVYRIAFVVLVYMNGYVLPALFILSSYILLEYVDIMLNNVRKEN